MQSDLLCIDRNYRRHTMGDIGPWQMSSDYTLIGRYHFLDQDDDETLQPPHIQGDEVGEIILLLIYLF